MGTQKIGCAACGHTYPLSGGATEVVCPECGHPYSESKQNAVSGDNGFVAPDPEGAAIGRIPLRRKRVSKTGLPSPEGQSGVSGVDLPRRPQQPTAGEELRGDDARRALEQNELLSGYGRPVVHDLSAPGLDPPPLPVDSEPELRLPQKRKKGEGPPASDLAGGATKPLDNRARPAAVPPQQRRPRKGPLEVSAPTAGLERRVTDGDAAIMVFVPDAPARDAEPAADRIGGGHHRRSRPTVPMNPDERPRVRRPTASHGTARAQPEEAKQGSAWPWVLFVVGLLAAVTVYLMLTR